MKKGSNPAPPPPRDRPPAPPMPPPGIREKVELIFDALNNKTSRLEIRVEELESALRFYADSDNYTKSMQIGRKVGNYVKLDGGERARKSLYGE